MTKLAIATDALGKATDRLVIDLVTLLEAADKAESAKAFTRTLSDWCAELIGRATNMAAQAVLSVAETAERRSNGNTMRVSDLHQRLDAYDQRLAALEEKAVGND
jgi:hypothetical protein